MKLVDQLIIKAKKWAHNRPERLIQAFITFDESSSLYKADCRIWNGIKGSGSSSIVSEHETQQEAINAIYRVADEYPNKNDIRIFIDDLD